MKTVTKCDWCKERLRQPRRGRRRTYCTASCRQRAYETRRLEREVANRLPAPTPGRDMANVDIADVADRDAFRRAVVDILEEFGLLPPSAGRTRSDPEPRAVEPGNPEK